MIGVVMGADVPVDITRDEAREAAERELSKGIYHLDDPSLLERGISWLFREFTELLTRAGQVSPGGYTGLVVLALLAVVAVVAIRLAIGRVARTATADRAVFDASPRTAAAHHSAADEHAARGVWAEAVRERLRAIVRGLEERDLLEPRTGRTAHEAATEAGAVLPGCAGGLHEAARIFDDVWYGSRPAVPEMDARLRAVDTDVRAARPVIAAPRAGS